MVEKLIGLMKNSAMSFPKLLIHNYQKLNITDKEFIVLIYLINELDMAYNPKKISSEINMNLSDVLECVNGLSSKGIISLEMRKNNSVREEYLNVDNLYHKLAFLVMDKKEKEVVNTLYDQFEKEFGRTLSPIEYELIGGWKDLEFNDEIILLALKEAVYNGVFNLRYIDKILYEWKKKGVKSKDDVEALRQNFKNKKSDQELVDYDWLNEK